MNLVDQVNAHADRVDRAMKRTFVVLITLEMLNLILMLAIAWRVYR